MNKTKTKKEVIQSSAKRFFEEQVLVRSYLKGKIDKKTLDAKGIKLKMPL